MMIWINVRDRGNLAHFPVQGPATQKRVVFDLFQTSGGAQAFLVARRSVAGSRLALLLGFSAFEYDDVAWHECDFYIKNIWRMYGELTASFALFCWKHYCEREAQTTDFR